MKRGVFILRNWLVQLLGVGMSKICRIRLAGYKILSLKAVHWQNSLWWGCQEFSVLRRSTGWMRPTHIMKSNLLFSVSTDVNVNFILNEKTKTKHLYSSIQTSVWPNVWKLWPSQTDM